MCEIGGVPGHHVNATRGLARALVKAVSPAARGRSGAESLDEGEVSPRITNVMTGLVGMSSRCTGRARLGKRPRSDGRVPVLDVGCVLLQQVVQPVLFCEKGETKGLGHTQTSRDSHHASRGEALRASPGQRGCGVA